MAREEDARTKQQAGTQAEVRVSRSLAENLLDELGRACDGRLSEIHVFRTDWQHGGATTAVGTWNDEGQPRPAVIKLPINQRELTWLTRLQDTPDPLVVPRVHASGTELAGYDMAWVVIERIEHGPLALRWHEDHLERITDAAAKFARGTSTWPCKDPVATEDWDELLDRSRKSIATNRIDDMKQWKIALKKLNGSLGEIVQHWRARQPVEWIHGDLHPANALSRQSETAGDVCLIDLAEMRPGHWIEDAIYLERLLWTHPDRLKRFKIVKSLATRRKELGLANGPDYQRLAAIRRTLLSATAPAFMKSEGSASHLSHCLDQLQRNMAQAVSGSSSR